MTDDSNVLSPSRPPDTQVSGEEPQRTDPSAAEPKKKQRRGFAAMSAEKQREIASLGGKAAHAKGVAHEFTEAEARVAGRLGGIAARNLKKETE